MRFAFASKVVVITALVIPNAGHLYTPDAAKLPYPPFVNPSHNDAFGISRPARRSAQDPTPPLGTVDDVWERCKCKGANLLKAMYSSDAEAAKLFQPPPQTVQAQFKEYPGTVHHHSMLKFGLILYHRWPAEMGLAWLLNRGWVAQLPVAVVLGYRPCVEGSWCIRSHSSRRRGWGREWSCSSAASYLSRHRGYRSSNRQTDVSGQWKNIQGGLPAMQTDIVVIANGALGHGGFFHVQCKSTGWWYVHLEPLCVFGWLVSFSVIIALNRKSPKTVASERKPPIPDSELPELKKWSDVAWLYYRHRIDLEGVKVRRIRYFLSLTIINENTKHVMDMALSRVGKDIEPWPGHTFMPDSDGYNAILGMFALYSVPSLWWQQLTQLKDLRMDRALDIFWYNINHKKHYKTCTFPRSLPSTAMGI